MRAFAFAALFAAACGGSPRPAPAPPAPPPPAPVAPVEPAAPSSRMGDAEFEAMMQDTLAMFEAMGAAADASAGDCGQFATGLEQTMVDHQAIIARAKSLKGNADIDQRSQAWMQSHADAMAPVMKFAAAAQPCADDPRFQVVMQKLSEL